MRLTSSRHSICPLRSSTLPAWTITRCLGRFIGYDFRNAYVPGVALTGAGQTVALLECDGYNASDITSYRTTAGLPNVPLQNVLVDEFNGAPQDADAAKEVCLDIEMAISMAPGLSQIVVFEAGPTGIPNDILNTRSPMRTWRARSVPHGFSGMTRAWTRFSASSHYRGSPSLRLPATRTPTPHRHINGTMTPTPPWSGAQL